MLLVLLAFVLGARADPACAWLCDSPVCEAVCTPVCTAPRCSYTCQPNNATFCYQPACWNDCSNAVFNATECPACETRCSQLQCTPSTPPSTCQIECEALSCYWECRKPTNCPQPTCQLQCENYSCRQPDPSSGARLEALLVMLGMLLFL